MMNWKTLALIGGGLYLLSRTSQFTSSPASNEWNAGSSLNTTSGVPSPIHAPEKGLNTYSASTSASLQANNINISSMSSGTAAAANALKQGVTYYPTIFTPTGNIQANEYDQKAYSGAGAISLTPTVSGRNLVMPVVGAVTVKEVTRSGARLETYVAPGGETLTRFIPTG